jgi:membrane carboxypeptidase/penicillin-binding protein
LADLRVQPTRYVGGSDNAGGDSGRLTWDEVNGELVGIDPFVSPRLTYESLFGNFVPPDPAEAQAAAFELTRRRSVLDTLRVQNPGRYRVMTTLDARLQQHATQLVNEHSAALARQNVHNAAALVVDNTTFEVLAYVGNAGNGDGHAVDIVRRPRSTGSILKPLLYAAMLEDGQLTPRMLLPDVPTHYEGFSPENFDRQYRGAVPADEAGAAAEASAGVACLADRDACAPVLKLRGARELRPDD